MGGRGSEKWEKYVFSFLLNAFNFSMLQLYISFLHFLKDKKGVISTSKQLCQKLAFCGHHGSYSCVLLYAEYNSHVSVEGLYFLLVRTNVSVL